MARRRRRNRLPDGEFETEITELADDGCGVAYVGGKATFVHGALPGERITFRYTSRRRGRDEAQVVSVIQAAAERVQPRCSQYGVCGGCSLQHMQPDAQIAAKQAVMLEKLHRIGGVEPATVLPPIINASPWGYRRKARLGVKDVAKKGKVLVGFRERGSSFVTDVDKCHVLHPRVGELLPALSELIGKLSISRRLPQIEMAMDDDRCVLILRLLDPLSADDEQHLRRFQADYDIAFYVQPGGPETVAPLNESVDLHYRLPVEDLTLAFLPGDFTQVNSEVNHKMVAQAITLLQPRADEQVLDLFCGIGNFTLPLALHAASVVGVEGDAGLVERARLNAERNTIANAEFFAADLYGELRAEPWMGRRFEKALLDPPRSGARQVLSLLPSLGVRRIVYVSCYPGTLARDAGELVDEHGYTLQSAGVIDMFPHTAHVESITLFEKV